MKSQLVLLRTFIELQTKPNLVVSQVRISFIPNPQPTINE